MFCEVVLRAARLLGIEQLEAVRGTAENFESTGKVADLVIALLARHDDPLLPFGEA